MHPYRLSVKKQSKYKYRLLRDDLVTYHNSYFVAWISALFYTLENPLGMSEVQKRK